MSSLFIYMVKAAFYLVAFYLVYSLLLSRDTFYGRNRAFILLAVSVSLIMPQFTLQTVRPMNIQFFGKILSEVFVYAEAGNKDGVTLNSTTSGILQIVYTIYITGVFVFLLKFIIDLVNLIFLILRHKSSGSRIIRFHGFNTSGFSAMGFIFINTRLNSEEAGDIIRHEQNHLKNNHFFDIIFIEIIKAFQWFNPSIYFFDRSLRAIHEFQADKDCISSGIPVVNYQSLLLSQVFKSRSFNLGNSFSNPSLVKKRMVMMTKKPTAAIARVKLILVIPAVLFVFFAISAYREIPAPSAIISKSAENTIVQNEPALNTVKQVQTPSNRNEIVAEISVPPPPPPPPAKQNAIEETGAETNTVTLSEAVKEDEINSDAEPFVVVEDMPMYPGGDIELLKYIGENTQYPESAKLNNIQGRVIIRFCVTSKGDVSQLSVLKGVAPDLDTEALRVVSTLKGFKPGKQGGKAVPVWYMVPITFTLK